MWLLLLLFLLWLYFRMVAVVVGVFAAAFVCSTLLQIKIFQRYKQVCMYKMHFYFSLLLLLLLFFIIILMPFAHTRLRRRRLHFSLFETHKHTHADWEPHNSPRTFDVVVFVNNNNNNQYRNITTTKKHRSHFAIFSDDNSLGLAFFLGCLGNKNTARFTFEKEKNNHTKFVDDRRVCVHSSLVATFFFFVYKTHAHTARDILASRI